MEVGLDQCFAYCEIRKDFNNAGLKFLCGSLQIDWDMLCVLSATLCKFFVLIYRAIGNT